MDRPKNTLPETLFINQKSSSTQNPAHINTPNHKGQTGDIVVVKLNKSSARQLVGRTQKCSRSTRLSHICGK